MSNAEQQAYFDHFENHYQYNMNYLREMLATSPSGFEKFNGIMPLVSHRELVDEETHWIAKLAAMKTGDCGECLQLNVKMAREAGMPADMVKAAIADGEGLSPQLKDVHDYAVAVVKNTLTDDALQARMFAYYSKGQLLELGATIGIVVIFPLLKRTVGYAKTCSLIQIEV